MPYQVGKAAGIGERMRALADLASRAGIRQAYLDALTRMLERLQRDPRDWGDPLYHAKHEDGMFHAHTNPIRVRYVVYEIEKKVMIIDIQPLFNWSVRP